jgi:HAMP domain-containing protein
VPDSAVSHLGHVAASCAVILDAIAAGNFKDDRPKLKTTELDALRTALETLPDNWATATHSVR